MSEAAPVRLDHVMLPVADMARSIAFYAAALSMEVVARRVDKRRRAEVVHIGWGERGAGSTIELVQAFDDDAVDPLPNMHVAFATSDLAGLAERWRRETPQLRNAADKALVEKEVRVWIQDPDGHVIEILQWPQNVARRAGD
jgi:catechol 2,3-dioxygenase-like lactoylglutathione lyase family enzyme